MWNYNLLGWRRRRSRRKKKKVSFRSRETGYKSSRGRYLPEKLFCLLRTHRRRRRRRKKKKGPKTPKIYVPTSTSLLQATATHSPCILGFWTSQNPCMYIYLYGSTTLYPYVSEGVREKKSFGVFTRSAYTYHFSSTSILIHSFQHCVAL